MKWLLLFITINSETVVGEYSTYDECRTAAIEYFDPIARDEVFVCREKKG